MRNILAYLHLFIYSLSQHTSSGLVTIGQSLWMRKQTQSFSNSHVLPQPGPDKAGMWALHLCGCKTRDFINILCPLAAGILTMTVEQLKLGGSEELTAAEVNFRSGYLWSYVSQGLFSFDYCMTCFLSEQAKEQCWKFKRLISLTKIVSWFTVIISCGLCFDVYFVFILLMAKH